MRKIAQLCFVLALGTLLVSCGGSSSLDNTEASVFLTVNIDTYNPDIDICSQIGDVSIADMTITSSLKDPSGTATSNQDVNLTRWVITPYRTDGGTTPSPEWVYDQAVFVEANGEAALSNYRVYPFEYLSEIPLAYLLSENGGFDPETGNTNIRESLKLQIFGQTVSGKSVATQPVSIAFNFYCFGQ